MNILNSDKVMDLVILHIIVVICQESCNSTGTSCHPSVSNKDIQDSYRPLPIIKLSPNQYKNYTILS
jgi:hypothetical protein